MNNSKNKQDRVGLTAIRNALGFNQELMAIYLQINISSLKMAEAGHRPLPTNALIKVAELEIQLSSKSFKSQHEDPHPEEDQSPDAFRTQYLQLISKEKRCAYDCFLLERKLESMLSVYWIARERLKTIEQLLNADKAGEFDSYAWQRQKRTALNMLNKSGKALQVLLKSKIDMLQAEIELSQKARLQIREALPELFSADDDTPK